MTCHVPASSVSSRRPRRRWLPAARRQLWRLRWLAELGRYFTRHHVPFDLVSQVPGGAP